jgi:hypothetical protein
VAVGILVAPLIAASRLARAMGIDLIPEDIGFDSHDIYHSPVIMPSEWFGLRVGG